MSRPVPIAPATIVVALSAIVLAGCGRAPTPSLTGASALDPLTSVAALAGAASVAQAADVGVARADDADLRDREAELEAREAELRAQQEALRRERERLDAEAARRGDASGDGYEADQATTPTTGASRIERVATPPIMVPAGTPVQIELVANVNTKIAREGDPVEGRLAEDLVVDGRRAAVAGATVSGKVTELVSGSDRIGGAPTLALTFDALQAANGATVPVVARYRQQADSETAEDAAKVVGGAAAGAVIGHQVGDDDRGTVIGGILGGAAGAAAAQKTGGEVKLRAGTVITATTETSFSIY